MNAFMNSVRFHFLYIDFYSFGRSWLYPESQLPYNLIRYIYKGSAVFFIDGKETVVQEGDMVYLPHGSRLACHALNNEVQFYSIRFTSSMNYDEGDLLTDYFRVPTLIRDCHDDARQYFEKIFFWIKTEEESRMFWVRGYLDILIACMIDKGKQNEPRDAKAPERETFTLEWIKHRSRKSHAKVDSRIQIAVDYMILHPTEHYTIKRMSEMAELSESRFRTLFKQQIGKNPLEYLNEMRVMAAARKLLLSGDHISDIAYSLGFEDSNYFIRVFKKYFCMTPKQYRENSKE